MNNINKNFGINLKSLLKANHKSQKELAGAISTSQANVSNWIKGTHKPSNQKLTLIADFLSVPLSALLSSESDETIIKTTQTMQQLVTKRRTAVLSYARVQLEEQVHESEALFSVPEIETVTFEQYDLEFAAGAGISLDEIYHVKPERVTLPASEIPSHFVLSFVVRGNSASPLFEDGDPMFGFPSTMITTEGLYAVQYDGSTFMKYIIPHRDHLTMHSFNNEEYPDWETDPEITVYVIAKIIIPDARGVYH